MTSSNETPSTRDTLKDQFLAFNCGQFKRDITAGRPLSHRWVTAKECLCTDDTPEICDPTRLYDFNFYELSDEAMAQRQRDLSEKYPDDIPPDQIGVFGDGPTSIFVPPHFMDVVWNAALAADGVLRTISLTAQPRKRRGGWHVFSVSLGEEMVDFFEWPLDKDHNPKFAPPRDNPAVVELRAVREQLRLSWWRVGPGIITIAVGVLLALWIAKLWR
jgi:hypothetical protein